MEESTQAVANVQEPAQAVEETVQQPTEQANNGTQEVDDSGFLIKTVVDGEEQVFDIRNPEHRQAIIDNTQKGIHYTKKMQSVSAIEKSNKDLLNFNRQITDDVDAMKILVARQYNLDPSALYSATTPPPAELAESNPQLYQEWQLQYRQKNWEREQIEKLTAMAFKSLSDANNTALFEQARLNANLNEQEYNQMKVFLQMNMKPNALGLYNEKQVKLAVDAIVGDERNKEKQINTIKQIDKALKNASTKAGMTTQTRASQINNERESFHRYVAEQVRR